MKNEPKKVFILNDDNYKEITYTQFKKLKNTNPAYINKYYIPIQGYLPELSFVPSQINIIILKNLVLLK